MISILMFDNSKFEVNINVSHINFWDLKIQFPKILSYLKIFLLVWPFDEPHQTTYHSYIGVLIREVAEWGSSTLGGPSWFQATFHSLHEIFYDTPTNI